MPGPLNPSSLANAPYEFNGVVTFQSIIDQPPVVIAEVDLSFAPRPSNPGGTPFQVRETGKFTFNKTFQIVSFDVQIPYFDTAILIQGADTTNTGYVTGLINGICSAVMASCTPGVNVDDTDQNDCVTFLSSSIPVGNWNRVTDNWVICRDYRTQFVPLTPNVECPNLGRSGGTKCVAGY